MCPGQVEVLPGLDHEEEACEKMRHKKHPDQKLQQADVPRVDLQHVLDLGHEPVEARHPQQSQQLQNPRQPRQPVEPHCAKRREVAPVAGVHAALDQLHGEGAHDVEQEPRGEVPPRDGGEVSHQGLLRLPLPPRLCAVGRERRAELQRDVEPEAQVHEPQEHQRADVDVVHEAQGALEGKRVGHHEGCVQEQDRHEHVPREARRRVRVEDARRREARGDWLVAVVVALPPGLAPAASTQFVCYRALTLPRRNAPRHAPHQHAAPAPVPQQRRHRLRVVGLDPGDGRL
mmetsp:Transcript_34476/g.67463  ORF Transcript_34476/g.67463 Transcript_34476/m.67463 type:complete len:288 (-) Transcript_34476:214-1077(-)